MPTSMKARLLLVVVVVACAAPPPALSTRDAAVGLLHQGIGQADVAFVRQYVGDHYTQHNPNVPDGPNGIIDMVKYIGTLAPSARPQPYVKRAFVDGDFVVLHSEYVRGNVHGAGIDVLRMERGKFVEHWDAGRPSPDKTKNGHTPIDGATDVVDLDKTAANKDLARRFVETVLVKRDFATYDGFFHRALVQHDPEVEDGPGAWRAAIDASPLRYEAVVRVLGEGNFVAVESRARDDGKLTVVWDLFRACAGAIAEHWITYEEIPAHMAHGNGMF
jgi:predicted SnoaL-like aldol condensation-catalyzing enzyme